MSRTTITTTYKALQLLDRSVFHRKYLLANELDISRPTLDSRLKGDSDWKKLEKNWINYLFNKL